MRQVKALPDSATVTYFTPDTDPVVRTVSSASSLGIDCVAVVMDCTNENLPCNPLDGRIYDPLNAAPALGNDINSNRTRFGFMCRSAVRRLSLRKVDMTGNRPVLVTSTTQSSTARRHPLAILTLETPR